MDVFSHSPNLSKSSGMIFQNISALGWAGFPSVLLCFALALSKKEQILHSKPFIIILSFISLFFVVQQWRNALTIDYPGRFYEWTYSWSNTIWTYLFFVYYFGFTLLSIGFIYRYGQQTSKYSEKKQAKIIITSIAASFILGTITDVIIPEFYTQNLPEFSNVTSILFITGMVYAIIKYGFLSITPAYAASDILSTMGDSLILIDPDGKIVETNQATLNLLGYTKDELIGKPSDILFQEGMVPFKTINLEKLSEKGLKTESLINFTTKHGQNIPISFSGSVMSDKDHQLMGMVCIAKDMREILRLQAREQELIIEEARNEVLQERAQELQKAYDRLKAAQTQLIQSDKMAVVGRLAGGVAHEINNPIGVILGFAQSILKRIPENDPRYMPLRSIEREAMRCKKLVENLLTFSRIGKTQKERVDINHAIEETLSIIEAQTKVKDIEIVRKYETGLPLTIVNKNQIQQVMVNICNNAVDAMADGGTITITTKQVGEHIEIEISDTGVGMTGEIKQRIFEPFFTTKDIGKGTGLGLSLCYEIIQQHEGTIEVESEAGKGAKFVIKLPERQGEQ
jgi:PAS domain S-box-containing protein